MEVGSIVEGGLMKRPFLSKGLPYTSLMMFLLCFFWKRKTVSQRVFAWIFGELVAPSMAKRMREKKAQLFAPLKEAVSSDEDLQVAGPGCVRILEIGVGSGTNLEFYPPGSRLVSLDPNPFFQDYFKRNRIQFSHVVLEKIVENTAENMQELEDGSVDAVVSTLVLCSVDNLPGSISEIYRVLAPGGTFYYLEHVAYPSNTLSFKFQQCLEPVWKLASDGCKLTAPISETIRKAPFKSITEEKVDLKDEYYCLRPHIFGRATK